MSERSTKYFYDLMEKQRLEIEKLKAKIAELEALIKTYEMERDGNL